MIEHLSFHSGERNIRGYLNFSGVGQIFINRLCILTKHETQFPPLEEERANALEVAAQAHQEGKAQKEDGRSVVFCLGSISSLR